MNKYIALAITFLLTVFASLPAGAGEAAPARQLTSLEIVYVETHPADDEAGTPRGKARSIFKKFEPRPEGEKLVETLSMSEAGNKLAEKIAFENGYLDIPLPMYEALIRSLATYHVRTKPTFVSVARGKDQVQDIQSELAKKYPSSSEKTDFSLTLLPYRASRDGGADVTVWIGAIIFESKTNQPVWTYYVTVPFGPKRRGFNAEDGGRMAAVLINELLKEGLLKADGPTRLPIGRSQSSE